MSAVTDVSVPAPKTTRGRWVATSAPSILIPATVLAALLFACFVLPMFGVIADPVFGELAEARLPPLTPGHLLGTDALGMDVLSRSLHGGRASFVVGIGAAAVGVMIGGFVGALSGFRGGWLDTVIARILDVFLSFPALVLALTIAAVLGASRLNEIIAVTFYLAPACARMARATAISVRLEDYITAARLGGASEIQVLTRHVLPNIAPTMLTFGILQVGIAIIVQSSLTFLGLGSPPPAPSWGGMMASGQQHLASSPWMVIVPGAFLLVTIMCLNLLGEAVRKKWNAR